MKQDKSKSVPLCDIQGSFQRFREPIEAAVQRVLASGQVILGPEVAAFEKEFAAACGVSYAVGCSSGSDALLLALCGLGVGPGDEVIMPTFTFFATAGAVCRLGATPVFADIDETTFNIDPAQVEDRITSRTKAIMPVHLFGQCADMTALSEIAERRRLPLIEDAAQSFGAEHNGRKAGSMGAAGCFSFYPTKTLGAFGDAGMVTTNNAALVGRLASLRVHGMETRYHHTMLGWNARLDAIQAAMLRVKLPFTQQDIQTRRAAARRYDQLIAKRDLDGLMAPQPDCANAPHTYNVYTVKVASDQRDALMQHLKTNGIGCEVYYPLPLHLQECLTYLGHGPGDFPISEEMSQRVLSLPMFPEITPEQQDRVIGACARFLRQPARLAA